MSIAIYLCVILCLFLFPQYTAKIAEDALYIWASDVLPTLFPYMVFCRLLCQKLRVLSFPAPLAAVFLGLTGGSPSGASAILAYSSRLSSRMLLVLCAFTGTISPMFLLSTIPTWMHTHHYGSILLISHWCGAAFSAIFTYILLRFFPIQPANSAPTSEGSTSSALTQSIDAILQVGGSIVCCSVTAGLLTKTPFFHGITRALFHSLIEISGGIHALSIADIPIRHKLFYIAPLCGFTSFSILFQNYAVLKPLGIHFYQLFIPALIRALGAGIMMAILFPFS
ncbi:MAG: hypothetical protein IJB85_04325 [Clostridia bacterium]|nr:hypothetical protein [Clostridia bacterium]